MAVLETSEADVLLRDEVDRILRSAEFRNSEVLRRLLVYLADRAAAGDGDNLKEYVVAIEGLGKPVSYDPQHNSAVRIQVGRLRQKLAEYYRNEGRTDPLVVHLPKGRFRLVCEPRETGPAAPALESATPVAEPLPAGPAAPVPIKPLLQRGLAWPALCTVLALALIICIGFLVRLAAGHPRTASTGWSADLEELWGPFASRQTPLLISVEDPLFVELHATPGVYYRDRSLNQWAQVKSSESMNQVARALHSPAIQPSHYYTAFGEVDAIFRLGRFLGPRVGVFTLGKASQLTWQQMSDNNVIFVGVENLFFEQTRQLPIQPQLQPVLEGVRDLHPPPNQPALFADHFEAAPAEEGMVYAVVTHAPGPLGTSDVESFTSNRSAGYVGAVQAFSNPAFARTVVEKLKASCGGRMPRYFQVLLQVSFTDDIPTSTRYVLGRELH